MFLKCLKCIFGAFDCISVLLFLALGSTKAANGCILIVKNVPCEECEQCGAKYYTDDVTEKLEQITNEAKSRMQELSVTDYSKVA